MARYIDADALKERLEDFSKWCRDGRKQGVDFVLDCPLPDMPTADVAPRAEWISVEDNLPGVIGKYICCVKNKDGNTWTITADYSPEMKTWFGQFGEVRNTVTHWMTLPEPPKES